MARPEGGSRGCNNGTDRVVPTLDSAAEWFLRLNGFFTVQNFIVHPRMPEEGTVQRTDADVLGVRFPGRKEIVGGGPLKDHPAFQSASQPLFVIAEVKAGACRINGPWRHPGQKNIIVNVLRSFGRMSPARFEAVAQALYQSGVFESDNLVASLLCFGAATSEALPEGVVQFTWDRVFGFIYDRYRAFWSAKCQNRQWPPTGRFLWRACSECHERDAYVQRMLKTFGVRGSNMRQ